MGTAARVNKPSYYFAVLDALHNTKNKTRQLSLQSGNSISHRDAYLIIQE